jgi:hypothetical protein
MAFSDKLVSKYDNVIIASNLMGDVDGTMKANLMGKGFEYMQDFSQSMHESACYKVKNAG